jgi:hypothetical protein
MPGALMMLSKGGVTVDHIDAVGIPSSTAS